MKVGKRGVVNKVSEGVPGSLAAYLKMCTGPIYQQLASVPRYQPTSTCINELHLPTMQ